MDYFIEFVGDFFVEVIGERVVDIIDSLKAGKRRNKQKTERAGNVVSLPKDKGRKIIK